MKTLSCSEHVADQNHNVMILTRNGFYDCYVMEHNTSGHEHDETPYLFMFGLPVNENSLQDAVDIAIANVQNYSWLFDSEEDQQHPCS